MSKLKEEMMKIHKNTDFKVNFAGVTQIGEFIYTHGGSVRPGLEYHIHYTNDKEEVFMTGNTHNPSSKIIEREKMREKNKVNSNDNKKDSLPETHDKNKFTSKINDESKSSN